MAYLWIRMLLLAECSLPSVWWWWPIHSILITWLTTMKFLLPKIVRSMDSHVKLKLCFSRSVYKIELRICTGFMSNFIAMVIYVKRLIIGISCCLCHFFFGVSEMMLHSKTAENCVKIVSSCRDKLKSIRKKKTEESPSDWMNDVIWP